jgi:hypothetical protein
MRSTDTIAVSAYTYDYTQRIKIMLPHITEAFAKVGSNKVERERERERRKRERERAKSEAQGEAVAQVCVKYRQRERKRESQRQRLGVK